MSCVAAEFVLLLAIPTLFIPRNHEQDQRAWRKLGEGAIRQDDLLSRTSPPDVRQMETNHFPKPAPGMCPMGCATNPWLLAGEVLQASEQEGKQCHLSQALIFRQVLVSVKYQSAWL